ncbi:protein NYNRIN-like [Parasteatoda tepidariorum]|uniref:protein NYNRIN-like n=1 Tax=Parasteatoda tepidariorum TaxID=114398 RepID=UPI00077F9584|nr:protein NYNRIN-like [Parasteatoda tepidariorum]
MCAGPKPPSPEVLMSFYLLCKQSIANAALLAHPYPNAKISLSIDASDLGIGAVLQHHIASRTEPLAFFSRRLTPAESSDNVVADAFSRIEVIDLSSTIDYAAMAEAQSKDAELKELQYNSSLMIKPIVFSSSDLPLFCDTSTGNIRLSLKKDCVEWYKKCLDCQRSKIARHTKTPLGQFPTAIDRFRHVRLDIVGPLPPSQGYTYILTGIDRFTRWPEAIPLKDQSAESVPNAFFSGWVARFGVPEIITTDKGRYFKSNLFLALSKSLGTKRNRTTAYHSSANGMIERFHRQLKGALRCSLTGTERWIEEMPIVLLGIRTALKEDLNTSTAELTLRQCCPKCFMQMLFEQNRPHTHKKYAMKCPPQDDNNDKEDRVQ